MIQLCLAPRSGRKISREAGMQKRLPQEATKRHEKGETERMAADRSTMESEARALGVGDGIALVLVAIPSPLAL
jgi:hypothetical protein